MNITELFTYTERVDNAAQSYVALKNKYLDPTDTTQSFRYLIAAEWQVNPLDLDSKVWSMKHYHRRTNNVRQGC